MGGLTLDVTEEQRIDVTVVDGEDDTGVVGHRPRVDAPRRSPHGGVDPPGVEPVAEPERLHLDAPRGGPAADLPHLVGRLRDRRGEDASGPPAAQGARKPLDVVGMEVGEDDRVEDVDRQRPQAPVDEQGVRPDVDDHGVVLGRPEDDRVPLADVADDHPPPRWRPGHARRGKAGGDEHGGGGEDRHRTPRRVPAHPGPDEQGEQREEGEQRRPERPVGPRHRPTRHVGQGSGDPGDAEGRGRPRRARRPTPARARRGRRGPRPPRRSSPARRAGRRGGWRGRRRCSPTLGGGR